MTTHSHYRIILQLLAVVLLAMPGYAQAPGVIVRLLRPPPTQLHVEMLWRIDLINSGGPRAIRMYGFALESRSGRRIADGLSDVFEIPTGFSSVNPNDIGPIDYNADAEYDDIVTRTGRVPSGEYTICMYAIDDITRDTLGRDCFSEHVVLNVLPPQLIYPIEGRVLTEPHPLFTWTPVSPFSGEIAVSYKMRVVEIIGRQSPFDAMESNPPWFEQDEISGTVVPYPLSAEPFTAGTEYAWQVIASVTTGEGREGELARSEVGWFVMIEGSSGEIGDLLRDTATERLREEEPDEPDENLDSDRGYGWKNEAVDPTDVGSSDDGEEATTTPETSLSDRNRRERAAEKEALRAEEMISLTESCDNLEMVLRRDTENDSGFYQLVITNKYRGTSADFKPKSLRIRIANDSVVSVTGGPTKGWERMPSKFPPGSASVTWQSQVETIPNGEVSLGNIRFAAAESRPFTVVHEWLNKDGAVICRDSSLLNRSPFYYDIGSDYSGAIIEVPNEALHVQYTNDYASSNNISITIYDAESQAPVAPAARKEKVKLNNLNGLNRVMIPLPDYKLVPDRYYILVISDDTKVYRVKFKLCPRLCM